MHIIDNKNDLSVFLDFLNSNEYIIIPILLDKNKHISINKLCLLYICDLSGNDAILSYDHVELDSIESSHQSLLDKLKDKIIFVLNNKSIIFLPTIKNIYSIELLEYIRYGEIKTNFNIETSAHKVIYNNFSEIENINKCIPIVKYIEYFNNTKDKIIDVINLNRHLLTEESYINYNNIVFNSFLSLESSGIHVSSNFKHRQIVYNDLIYPNYNLYTKTGRPSCSSGVVNLLAINKHDGSREFYDSRFGNNGVILLMDYKSRHLYLIAEILRETFEENPHTYFGKIYTGKDILTEEEYNESKKITYQLLYGNIPDEFEVIPFFNKVKIFMNELHDAYNSDGFVITPLYKRKLYKSTLGDLKKQTLFNYYLQAMETEYGVDTMKNIISVLKQYETKCILYVYDSFLFDFNISDDKELLDKLNKIVSNDNKFPVKIEYGKNYNNLNQVFMD